MTLAVGVAVPEGIVLGADSRMSYGNPRGWPRTASDYGFKVFEVTKHVAAATFGWAYLNRKNINSLIEEFKLGPVAKNDLEFVDDILPHLLDFFEEQYNLHIAAGNDKPVPPGNSAFGFLVGGYDQKNTGKLFEMFFPGKVMRPRAQTETPGANWAGQYDVVNRLINGWDPRLDFSKIPDPVRKMIEQEGYVVRFQNMTLQDAVDFVIFLIRTTIDMQRFSDGILAQPGDLPGVGGPIDIAVVTPHEFRWVQKKKLVGERATVTEALIRGPSSE